MRGYDDSYPSAIQDQRFCKGGIVGKHAITKRKQRPQSVFQ
jgi:hypothetical protein